MAFRVPLLGGFAIPANGLDVVLWYSFSMEINRTQPELRLRVSLLGTDSAGCHVLRKLLTSKLGVDKVPNDCASDD